MPKNRIARKDRCHITYIYALCEPSNGMVRYIGKADNVQLRFSQHLSDARWTVIQSKKEKWINDLLLIFKKPTLKIIAIVPYEKWREKESEWIQVYFGKGRRLKNGVF